MSDMLAQGALAISGMIFAGLWEGAIIVAAVWVFVRLFPKLGASTRYAIWISALIALAVAPACTVAFSVQHASHALAGPVSDAAAAGSNAFQRTRIIAAAPPPQRWTMPVATPSPVRPRIDVPLALSMAVAALWLLVTGSGLVILFVHLRRLTALRRSADRLRVAFGYPVLASRRTNVPIAVGFVHPAVVLPSSLSAELSKQAVDAIVMHEVAHLRRYDVWTNALARILQAFLALNPSAWLVLARLSVEREIACDDWVVARLDAGEVFARALADMACRPALTSIAAPSAIGSKHAVVARIERLLDRRPRRLRLSGVALTGTLLVLTIFATTVPTLSPVLAFAPDATAHPNAAGCVDRPPLMETITYGRSEMRPSGRWIPLKYDAKMAGRPNSTVADVTIDANGKLGKVVVLSSPHERDAGALKRFLAMVKYRPAIVNCKAAASTVRIATVIDVAAPVPISIVRADYPFGWSSEHPGACRVPDLIHGGVPDVRLVMNKTVTASVLVHVDKSGSVTKAVLSQSSGNLTYDEATLAAARAGIYPLSDSTGFKPVRPSGASLSWNATHGYSLYSKCTPLPAEYTWTTTFPPESH